MESSKEVYKKEHPHNAANPTNLVREIAVHRIVRQAFERYAEAEGCSVRVPRLGKVYGTELVGHREMCWWEHNVGRFRRAMSSTRRVW
jgi:hypothetical protein